MHNASVEQQRTQLRNRVWLGLWAASLCACADGVAWHELRAYGRGGQSGPQAAPKVCVPTPAATPTQRCSENGSDPSLPACRTWQKVEPAGAVCSDGSPYKFFINYAAHSDNLLVMFEPGGACWDYESCSGAARGAVNPHGLTDDHVARYQSLNLLRRSPDNPASDWNFVFVSYCTGDIHVGDKVAEYPDPNGGPPLTYRHVGLSNTQHVIDYVQEHFANVPQLLVTGCSAGGIGALQNYAFVRDGVRGTQCGYLLDDSGPSFHSGGASQKSFDTVRPAWNSATFTERLAEHLRVPVTLLERDPAAIHTALADRYPTDRFSLSAYRSDLNYSLYLYETYYPDATTDDIHAMFWTELQGLMKTFDTRSNLAYYVPYFRHDNCSHCVSIPPFGHDQQTIATMPWLGSEIQSADIDLHGFVEQLLDNTQPLASYVEDINADETFTDDELATCRMP
ncbi:MAG: hypothetical protein RL701_2646 [Pseudomonadota bacterium]|jgi:hypothetical protein